MDKSNNHIILYSPQDTVVWHAVDESGVSLSRREYVSRKYEESARIFLTAYDAYIREAEKIVPRNDDDAYPYWAFVSTDSIDASDRRVMKLRVPLEETVLFDQYDWYKVLRLSYIGETHEEEKAFMRELERRGIKDSSDAVLKPFYPDMKRKIISSWSRLFRYDAAMKDAVMKGQDPVIAEVNAVQAGLWQIKKEWLI